MLEDILKKCYGDEKNADKSNENKTIKTAVLSRIEEGKPVKKKINKKALLIPAIAAAALLTTTVGVAAANGWNLKTAISGLFNEDKNDDSAFYGYDINGIGSKKIDRTFERDGYKINTVGVVADEYTAYLLYDIVVEKGYVFQQEDAEGNIISHTYSPADSVELNIGIEPDSINPMVDQFLKESGNNDLDRLYASDGGQSISISQEGNVYHCATRFDIKPLSLENEELTFNLRHLSVDSMKFDGKVYNPNREYETLTVKFDFINIDGAERLIEVNRQFDFGGEAFMLESVELTPFSIYLRVKNIPGKDLNYDEIDAAEYHSKFTDIIDSAKLGLKDGSTTDSEMIFRKKDIGYSAFTYGDQTIFTNLHIMWKHPVNVDDIETITIGDTTFTLN